MLISGHSEVQGRVNFEAQNGMELSGENTFYKTAKISYTEWRVCFLLQNASEQNSESLLLYLFHGTKFRVVFSSAEWLGMEFREFASFFVPGYWIPSIFLWRGKVQNGIPRVCFNFCSTVRNSEHFFLFREIVWNGILRVFYSVEQPEFCRNKPFVSSIPSTAELFFVGNSQPTLAHAQIKTQPSLPPALLKIQLPDTNTGPYTDNWWSF